MPDRTADARTLNEIDTEDPKSAKTFYSSVFGWKYKESEIPGIEYYLIDGVSPNGAINPHTDPAKAKAPTIYFHTDDIDATLQKVRESGGTADKKQPIPGQAGSPAAPTRMGTRSPRAALWLSDELRGFRVREAAV